MKQNAIVKKIIRDTLAEVEVQRSSACGEQCASCSSGCGIKKTLTVTAINTAGAKPGDKVIIESGTAKVVLLALFVYILPLVIFLMAYFLASSFKLSEGACTIISVGMFLLGCGCVVLINKKLRRDRKLQVEITSVIT
ncbi:MAG: SoxR reducing system RseC family protein [Clostridiales bacterium]|jgi:sigma-E factor negative regulatory protein RseC|nr:SoxR reducing system RseC family protein [Clostridiales bacterium]